MKGQRRILAEAIGVLVILLLASGVYAKIPEPDNIIYGLAREDAVFTTIEVNGVELDRYTQGDNPDAGDYYILRVPIDSYDPQEPGTARPGDTGYIYINGETTPAAIVTIGERGTVQVVHLSGADSDNDGVVDVNDTCPGTPADEIADVDANGCSPSQDADGDGSSTTAEIAAGSDPYNPDSRPGSTTVVLKKGYNQVTFPAETMIFGDLFALLDALDGGANIKEAMVFDYQSQSYKKVTYTDGIPAGDNIDLPIAPNGLNLVIYADHDATINFDSEFCPAWDLFAGVNLVGTPCLPGGTTAFALLTAITNHAGAWDAVISLQHFNRVSGSFETSINASTGAIGVDFAIDPGEALIINMRQPVVDFRP